jgi:hypothetical protein
MNAIKFKSRPHSRAQVSKITIRGNTLTCKCTQNLHRTYGLINVSFGSDIIAALLQSAMRLTQILNQTNTPLISGIRQRPSALMWIVSGSETTKSAPWSCGESTLI